MNLKLICLALLGCVLLVTVTACRESPESHEDIIRADFAEILALQDAECGGVESYQLQDQLDYVIHCESGHVYRIHVSHEGHVRVTPDQN